MPMLIPWFPDSDTGTIDIEIDPEGHRIGIADDGMNGRCLRVGPRKTNISLPDVVGAPATRRRCRWACRCL